MWLCVDISSFCMFWVKNISDHDKWVKVDDLRISIKGLGHEESDKEGHYGQNINNVHPVLDNDNDQDTMMLIMIGKCRIVNTIQDGFISSSGLRHCFVLLVYPT